MAWINYNPNPKNSAAIDCSVRALCKALDLDWDTAFLVLMAKAYEMKNVPSANSVWGAVLRDHGFSREILPNTCPQCYTLEQFCKDHPEGVFVVALDDHVACVIDGDVFDSWDSTGEMPLYYFFKEDEK